MKQENAHDKMLKGKKNPQNFVISTVLKTNFRKIQTK